MLLNKPKTTLKLSRQLYLTPLSKKLYLKVLRLLEVKMLVTCANPLLESVDLSNKITSQFWAPIKRKANLWYPHSTLVKFHLRTYSQEHEMIRLTLLTIQAIKKVLRGEG